MNSRPPLVALTPSDDFQLSHVLRLPTSRADAYNIGVKIEATALGLTGYWIWGSRWWGPCRKNIPKTVPGCTLSTTAIALVHGNLVQRENVAAWPTHRL